MPVQFDGVWSTCYSRCILSVSTAMSCHVLPCPALSCLDVLLNIIIWVYILVCVFLFLPRVCTVTKPQNGDIHWRASLCSTKTISAYIYLLETCQNKLLLLLLIILFEIVILNGSQYVQYEHQTNIYTEPDYTLNP